MVLALAPGPSVPETGETSTHGATVPPEPAQPRHVLIWPPTALLPQISALYDEAACAPAGASARPRTASIGQHGQPDGQREAGDQGEGRQVFILGVGVAAGSTSGLVTS